MVIKVLGTGCSKCKALYAAVEKVVKENGINAELIKEEDLEKIMSYHVMALPALVVDEKVVGLVSGSSDLSFVFGQSEVIKNIKISVVAFVKAKFLLCGVQEIGRVIVVVFWIYFII